MGLREIVEAGKVSSRLLELLRETRPKLRAEDISRLLESGRLRRVYKYGLHVSDLVSTDCPRRLALAFLGALADRDRTFREQSIIDDGVMSHIRLQSYLYQLPVEVEAPVYIDAWPILGEADALVKAPEGHTVIELKTTNRAAWDALGAPLPEHYEQANAYACLLGCPYLEVWYENRDTKDIKAYRHQANLLAWKRQLDKAYAAIDYLLREEVPPICTGCEDYTCAVEVDPEALKEVRALWDRKLGRKRRNRSSQP